MTRAGRAAKRVFDVVLALVLLLAGWWLLVAIAVAIRVDSKGPAVFSQERAGRDMQPFTMYKFRTMRTDVDPYGVSPTSGGDPRLTRVGRWLRETSLDELPQVFNVLKGDMSFVGPRPLYMSQAREFTPRQRRRLEVRPGITGLAQIQGRGELPHEKKLDIDVRYVERQSFWFDTKILLASIAAPLRRKDVYQDWE